MLHFNGTYLHAYKEIPFKYKGIEDKLISTKGYCMMITDEGTSFLEDLKRKETQNESYVTLLNQLYDGRGDKMTLAQGRQRVVPNNATCISVSVQPESFINCVSALGKTVWMDTGFSERFIITAIKPFR